MTNRLIPTTLGTNLEGWSVTNNPGSVLSNQVAVVTGRDLYPANTGTNYLALAAGQISRTIPTIVGQPYVLSYAYRGPGLLDWWPFEGDADDLIGTNNGTLSGPMTNVVGEVGAGFQFPGTNLSLNGTTIDFGATPGNFGTNDFTIDYWMNTTSTYANEAFLEKRPGCNANGAFFCIRVGAGTPPVQGIPVFEFSGDGALGYGSLVVTNQLNDGVWHHLAWVRKGNLVSVYVDGLLNNSGNRASADINTGSHLIMGTSICDYSDSAPRNLQTQPYSGAVDELDLWNRALSDVEIDAIYQAGANHIGKATTTSVLPNCEIVLNGATNTLITQASNTNWLTNSIYFTAVADSVALSLQGNPLGILFDDFILATPTNHNYVLPEQSLSAFTGENPAGCWTLDVWDTRNDSSALTNGALLSWDLQMTVSSSNVNLIVLTNHVAYTNQPLAAGAIQYFAFDVPDDANFATNRLTRAVPPNDPNASFNLLFNQTGLPTGNQPGDATLDTYPAGLITYALSKTSPPPTLLPGARYFLGVQNVGPTDPFIIKIDTDILTNVGAIPLTNTSNYTNTFTNANTPQYYSFVVPTNAILASFEIINPIREIDLYARHDLPLPTTNSFDYKASYAGTNDEAIVVTTNSIWNTTNSVPVPLTPGTWYLMAFDYAGVTPITYKVVATYVTNGQITIIPLTNFMGGVALLTNGSSTPGPALTNFYSFTINNTSVTSVQFVVSNMTGNVDLMVQDGFLPTPQRMTDGSFNPGTVPETVTIVTNSALPSLVGTWYLGVPNNTGASVSYWVTATTNVSARFTSPALAFIGLGPVTPTNGFTMYWNSEPSGQYAIDLSTNLTVWSNLTNITTTGSVGVFTDTNTVGSQTQRYYRLSQTQ